jgi:hypothetical protein
MSGKKEGMEKVTETIEKVVPVLVTAGTAVVALLKLFPKKK